MEFYSNNQKCRNCQLLGDKVPLGVSSTGENGGIQYSSVGLLRRKRVDMQRLQR